MATFHLMTDADNGKKIVRCYVKGALDVLVSRRNKYVDINRNISPLAGAEQTVLAAKGLRVMMIAYRDVDPAVFDPSSVTPESIRDLTIVAMTGVTGFNDTPALKAADIGVAMGITGNEVSKESAEMILTDDNFAPIVTAVRQGRVLYDNMLKFIRFQMANLMAYILLFLFAAPIVVGAYTGIFAPVQTLFIIYFITVPVGIALCYDTAGPGIMTKKPSPKNEKIMSGWFTLRMILVGIFWSATCGSNPMAERLNRQSP